MEEWSATWREIHDDGHHGRWQALMMYLQWGDAFSSSARDKPVRMDPVPLFSFFSVRLDMGARLCMGIYCRCIKGGYF